jgi:hypothetical protein
MRVIDTFPRGKKRELSSGRVNVYFFNLAIRGNESNTRQDV